MDKAEILEKLAEITAAVEALPDDTHVGQGVLPTETLTRFCKYGDTIQKPCTHAECRPGYVPDVWRTLTFGDLRAGDVVRLDEADPEMVIAAVDRWDSAPSVVYVTDNKGFGRYPHRGDPVLVRHPRPEVGA
jgi:hypothetical protein